MLIDGKYSDILRENEVKGSEVQREGLVSFSDSNSKGMNYKAVKQIVGKIFSPFTGCALLSVEESFDLSTSFYYSFPER